MFNFPILSITTNDLTISVFHRMGIKPQTIFSARCFRGVRVRVGFTALYSEKRHRRPRHHDTPVAATGHPPHGLRRRSSQWSRLHHRHNHHHHPRHHRQPRTTVTAALLQHRFHTTNTPAEYHTSIFVKQWIAKGQSANRTNTENSLAKDSPL